MRKSLVTSALAALLLCGTATNAFANTLIPNTPIQHTSGSVSGGSNVPTSIGSQTSENGTATIYIVHKNGTKNNLISPDGSAEGNGGTSQITMFQNGSKTLEINFGFTLNPQYGAADFIEGYINIYKGSLTGTKVTTLDEIFPIVPATDNWNDQVSVSVPSTGNYYAQLQGNVVTTYGDIGSFGSPTASASVYY